MLMLLLRHVLVLLHILADIGQPSLIVKSGMLTEVVVGMQVAHVQYSVMNMVWVLV